MASTLSNAELFQQEAKLVISQLNKKLIDPNTLSLLTRCYSSINEAESIAFLEQYLLKATEIVVSIDYTTYRIKAEIIKMLRDTVMTCARLAVAIMKGGLGSEALQGKVFDICGTLMSSHSSYHSHAKGDQQSKIEVISFLWDQGVFARFTQHLAENIAFWPGSSIAESFILAYDFKMQFELDKMNKVRSLAEAILERMVKLPDEILKTQQKKDVLDLFTTIRKVTKSPASKTSYWPRCYELWMEFSQKAFISTTSFVVKLYCWDLINELIRHAIEIKPPPSSYFVSGCGAPNEFICGEYKFKKYNLIGHPEYTMMTSQGEIYLFLCSLSQLDANGSKKYDWFISLPDKDSPGTASDIDYYRVPSNGVLLPPITGWTSAGKDSANNADKPNVEAGPGLIPIPDPILVHKVVEWLNTQDIVEHVLGASCHRELVKKSEQAFQLLLDNRAMSKEFVSSLWQMVGEKPDGDTTEQILEMVSAFLPKFDETLIAESRSVINSKMNFSDDVNLWKLSYMLEKISQSQLQPAAFSPYYAQFVLELLWIVFDITNFNGKNYSSLPALLLKLLELNTATTFRSHKIDTVMKSLQSDYPPADGVKFFTGLELLMRSKVEIDLSIFNKYVDILLADLRKCVSGLSTSSSSSSASTQVEFNSESLKLRLKILSHFMLKANGNEILMAQLSKVREILQINFRINEYFEFLSNFILLSAPKVCEVYQTFICDATIEDFSNADKEVYKALEDYVGRIASFKTFEDYFSPSKTFKEITADILWKVITQSQNLGIINKSIELLVKRICNIFIRDNDENIQNIIGNIRYRIEHAIQSGVKLSRQQDITVKRCVEVLRHVIKRDYYHEGLISHLASGSHSKMPVQIKYTSCFQKKAKDGKVYWEVDDSRDLELLVEPRQTIYDLKYLVAQLVKVSTRNVQIYDKKIKCGDCYKDSFHLDGLFEDNVVTAEYQAHRSLFLDETESCSAFKYLLNSESANGIYELLLQNCENVSSDVSSVIWDCLDYLPTSPYLVGRCLKADYSNTLDSSNRGIVAYSLEIFNNILQADPNDFVAGYEISIDKRKIFLQKFVESNGFGRIIDIILRTESNSDFINFKISTVCVNLLRYFINRLKNPQEQCDEQLKILISPKYASAVSEKLLLLAGNNSDSKNVAFMEKALDVISSILNFIDITSTIVKFPQAKSLVLKVFNSSSAQSRELATSFAIKIGGSQIVIFDWLLESISSLDYSNCGAASDMFNALRELVIIWSKIDKENSIFTKITTLLSDKLIQVCELRPPKSSMYLTFVLNAINQLISCDINYLNASPLRYNLHLTLYDKLLFPLQARFTGIASSSADLANSDNENDGLCDHYSTRCAAFTTLATYCGSNPAALEYVIANISQLNGIYTSNSESEKWNISLSREMRQPGIKYVGLKNQGLTCYMNSLLQQIFMNVEMRETILKTPLLSYHRSNYRKPEEMIGRHYFNPNFRAYVKSYDPSKKQFSVDWEAKGKPVEEKNLSLFLLQKGFKECPPADSKPISERDEKAIKIFDELQRVYCYLKYSNKRFYDPKQFVDACKSLNMNYDVYSQNDSTEFWDQVLDRIETAMKGTYTGVDMWEKMKQNVFGGSYMFTKTPKECETYSIDKKNCGHFKGAREEAFLKVELGIRGKESIEEALADLMKGELMDGDNKIKCEDCNKYMATVRRTSIGKLPKTLVVHLKRFDLNYETFETIKLNSRVAFPKTLDMKAFTKDFIEAKEAEEAAKAGKGAETASDILSTADKGLEDDAEYELQGVLIHTGVAQGGHYFSYIRGPNADDEWFTFDDDTISKFSKDQIDFNCFGGPMSGFEGVPGVKITAADRDLEKVSNALMLYYTKVDKSGRVAVSDKAMSCSTSSETLVGTNKVGGGSSESADTSIRIESSLPESVKDNLVTGYDAYFAEVQESNKLHQLQRYLFDSEINDFLRNLISSQIANKKPVGNLGWLGINFFIDIILHNRERTRVSEWLDMFKKMFASEPTIAAEFIEKLLNDGIWFNKYYVGNNQDYLSKGAFTKIFVSALAGIAPTTELSSDKHSLLCRRFVEVLYTKLTEVFSKTTKTTALNPMFIAEDIILLIKGLATILPICRFMNQELQMVNHLFAIIQPRLVPPEIIANFTDFVETTAQYDLASYLTGIILESIGALIGIPQLKQVDLVIEGRTFLDLQWTPLAKNVMTSIFFESCSKDARVMDYHDVARFLEKINKTKPTQAVVNAHLNYSNKVTLDQFLKFYIDKTKDTWKVLRAFNYRNDLTRVGPKNSGTSAAASASGPTDAHQVISFEQLGFHADLYRGLVDVDFIITSFSIAMDPIKGIIRRLVQIKPEISFPTLLFPLIKLDKSKKLSIPRLEAIYFILDEWMNWEESVNKRTAIDVFVLNKKFGILSYLASADPIVVNETSRLLSIMCQYYPVIMATIRANKDNISPQIYNKVKGTSPSYPTLCMNDIIDIKTLVLRVTGSQIDPSINGEYFFNQMDQGCGIYFHRNGLYAIHRSKDKGLTTWYLTALRDSKNKHLYYVDQADSSLRPPKDMFDYVHSKSKIAISFDRKDIDMDDDDEKEEEEDVEEDDDEDDEVDEDYYNDA